MAIGCYLATRRPQLTMFHVNVGTANAINGLLNASRGQVPILFTAGRAPIYEDTLEGHRSLDIHWTQEMFDQAAMTRESVKWDYELRNAEQLETIVDRMLQRRTALRKAGGGVGRVRRAGHRVKADAARTRTRAAS